MKFNSHNHCFNFSKHIERKQSPLWLPSSKLYYPWNCHRYHHAYLHFIIVKWIISHNYFDSSQRGHKNTLHSVSAQGTFPDALLNLLPFSRIKFSFMYFLQFLLLHSKLIQFLFVFTFSYKNTIFIFNNTNIFLSLKVIISFKSIFKCLFF